MHDWKSLVDELRTWKRGSERAVHKPLLTLMLLARAQRHMPRAVTFEAIRQPLTELLREFGPPRRSYHPEYPFWHLQSDGFWSVHDGAQMPYRGGGNHPTASTLLAANAAGEVPEQLWRALEQDPSSIPALARHVLGEFWPESLHEDIAEAVGLDLAESYPAELGARDPEFRPAVLRAYEQKCAICGFDAQLGSSPIGLEAAHIQFRQNAGPDHLSNALLLCTLHHKALDRGAIGITSDRRVKVSQDLRGSDVVRALLIDRAGHDLRRPIRLEQQPADQFLEWHTREVFRGPAR
jgi:putative restriction endonuclease